MSDTSFTAATDFLHRGLIDDAERAYRDALREEPEHFAALNDLGMLLARRGALPEALRYFAAAVSADPSQAVGHANLATLLLRGGDAVNARRHYEAALERAPENVEAHRGLALALAELGLEEVARAHRQRGFADAPLTTLPSLGPGSPLPLLLLVSESTGNTHFERLIDRRCFVIHKLVVEYADRVAFLPEHAVIVNAVGDVDSSSQALLAAERLITRSDASVINPPARITQTRREEHARRFAEIPGVRTPVMKRIARSDLIGPGVESRLTAEGLSFPLLVRSPGFHSGEHLIYVERIADLESQIAELPGDELLVLEYIDIADEQGASTKYRMLLVNGVLYPLHAAIAPTWKVHFFTAQSEQERERQREIDRAFLTDPSAVLGGAVVERLEVIARELGLDYGGIDFGVDRLGRVIVFEANATMVLPHVSEDPHSFWGYRNPSIMRIADAVHRMLLVSATQTVAQTATSYSRIAASRDVF